jgi:hypothetical protein
MIVTEEQQAANTVSRLGEIEKYLRRIDEQNAQILAFLQNAKDNRRWFDVDTAAKRLGRSTYTIRHLCSADLIRSTKGDDGRWRIPAEEIVRLEAEGVPKLPR